MYRIVAQQLLNKTSKITVLLGPRQAGKTTLLKNSFPDAAYINLELANYLDIFNSRDLEKIQTIINSTHGSDSKVWILDEVQRLNDPGLVAKVIHDELPKIRTIISGSSALEITNRASESLAGRKKTLHLFPLTFVEQNVQTGKMLPPKRLRINFSLSTNKKHETDIKAAMLHGMYPEIINLKTVQAKNDYLLELIDSILLKDVYYLNLIKSTKNLLSLLKLLAYQIGQQINITDIANRLGIARKTVIDYMEILKKTFVIFTLPPYTRKRRDEVGKTEKVYFYDLGVRNAVINDFSPPELRPDYGSLFENFVIVEILKLNHYYKERYSLYYWRTKWGSEVDLVMIKDQECKAVEIKIRHKAITQAFRATYPHAKEYVVTLDNIATLITT